MTENNNTFEDDAWSCGDETRRIEDAGAQTSDRV